MKKKMNRSGSSEARVKTQSGSLDGGGRRRGRRGGKRRRKKRRPKRYDKRKDGAISESDEEGEVDDEVIQSVVKIYATHCTPSYTQPWQMNRQVKSVSTGFIIRIAEENN